MFSKMIVKLRFVLALASFGVILVLAAAPQLYGLIVWHRLAKTDESVRRRRFGNLVSFWGTTAFRIITRIMKMSVRLAPPRDLARYRGRPVIAVPNHQSSFDSLVMIAYHRKLGIRDIRWIAKEELMKAPIVGRLLRELGCAMVGRHGISGDLLAVRYGAVHAFKDGASFLLFPEGTRFVAAKPDSGYENVLPPKVRGFEVLLRELGYVVLSPTIDWPGRNAARTVFDAESLFGRALTVRGRFAEVDPDVAGYWLRQEWHRKDFELSGTVSKGIEAG